jgi:hypothetical protein
VFNADTYGGCLEDIARQFRRKGALLGHDNASYYKDPDIWSCPSRAASQMPVSNQPAWLVFLQQHLHGALMSDV